MHDIDSWMDHSKSDDVGEAVHSISICLNVPRIIVLTFFDRLPKKEVKFTRHNVFERDKYTCQYCGRLFDAKELNLDHVVPRDKGGKTTWENVVCSCIRCNSKKANKLPHEVNMFPMREPRAPRWRPFFTIAKATATHESWRHFLKLDHQTVEVSD